MSSVKMFDLQGHLPHLSMMVCKRCGLAASTFSEMGGLMSCQIALTVVRDYLLMVKADEKAEAEAEI